MAKFWNPGFKWEYMLKFDNPTTDDKSSNISYYKIVAEAKSFFEVKDTQTIALPTGEEYEIPLRFKELIRTQYAEFGVVLVAPGRICTEEENIAGTDEEAKKKGNALWKEFLKDKYNEWSRIVREARQSGAMPHAASGLFKRVIDELGLVDPADESSNLIKAQEGQTENKEMMAIIQSMRDEINQLKGAKSAKGV